MEKNLLDLRYQRTLTERNVFYAGCITSLFGFVGLGLSMRFSIKLFSGVAIATVFLLLGKMKDEQLDSVKEEMDSLTS